MRAEVFNIELFRFRKVVLVLFLCAFSQSFLLQYLRLVYKMFSHPLSGTNFCNRCFSVNFGFVWCGLIACQYSRQGVLAVLAYVVPLASSMFSIFSLSLSLFFLFVFLLGVGLFCHFRGPFPSPPPFPKGSIHARAGTPVASLQVPPRIHQPIVKSCDFDIGVAMSSR